MKQSELVNQPGGRIHRKVPAATTGGGVGSALAVLVSYFLELPPEIAAALVIVASASGAGIAGWCTRARLTDL